MVGEDELIRRLVAERDTALEQVRQLRDLLGAQTHFWRAPAALRLTKSQEAIVRVLYHKERAGVRKLYDAVYVEDPVPRVDKVIDIFIWQARRRMAPKGVEIINIRGHRAWYMPQASKDIITRLLEEERCSRA